MQFNRIGAIIFLLLCIQIKTNLGQEALEVNTDYAEYKVLNEDQELELTCKNNVDSSQNVTWTPPNYVSHEKYTLDIKYRTVYTLTIKNAKREFAGKYTCMSHARNGDQLTKDIHVGVSPQIRKLLVGKEETTENKLVGFTGTNIILKCIDDNFTYPKSVYVWRKNNIKLEDDDNSELIVNENGTYTCELANSIGSSEKRSVIIVKYADVEPPSPACDIDITCTIGIIIAIIGFFCILFELITYRSSSKANSPIRLTIIAAVFLIILALMFIASRIKKCDTVLCIAEIVFGIVYILFFVFDRLSMLKHGKFILDSKRNERN